MPLEHCAFYICSWGIFAIYAPGALCIQLCSWSMFDLEYYSRLFMLWEQLLLEQLFLEQLLLEHNFGPKSQRSILALDWYCANTHLAGYKHICVDWKQKINFSKASNYKDEDSEVITTSCNTATLTTLRRYRSANY